MAKGGIQWQLSLKGKSHRGKKDTVFGKSFGRHLSQKGKWAVANVTERHLSQVANGGRHLGQRGKGSAANGERHLGQRRLESVQQK